MGNCRVRVEPALEARIRTREKKRRIDDAERAIDLVIKLAEQEREESFPDPQTIKINDLDEAWEYFMKLEAFSDGYGAWKVIDTLGKPLLDLPETLVEDLITLRWLRDIADNQKQKREVKNG